MTPIPDTPLFAAGTLFGNIGLVLALLFVLSYGAFFKWWSRPAGRAIMGFVSVIVALAALSWSYRTFGSYPAYGWVRLGVNIFAMVAAGGLLFTLWTTWLRSNPDGLEPNDKIINDLKKEDNDNSK